MLQCSEIKTRDCVSILLLRVWWAVTPQALVTILSPRSVPNTQWICFVDLEFCVSKCLTHVAHSPPSCCGSLRTREGKTPRLVADVKVTYIIRKLFIWHWVSGLQQGFRFTCLDIILVDGNAL